MPFKNLLISIYCALTGSILSLVQTVQKTEGFNEGLYKAILYTFCSAFVLETVKLIFFGIKNFIYKDHKNGKG